MSLIPALLLIRSTEACATPAPPGMGLKMQHRVALTASSHDRTHYDVTDAIADVLPPLPMALVSISAPRGCRLAILDPAILEVGPASVVAPERFESMAIGARSGEPLLPLDARILLLCDEGIAAAQGSSGDGSSEFVRLDEGAHLDVTVEASEPLLVGSSGLDGSTALAQAALRAALAAGGLSARDISELESLADPTPACRVYESFLARDHRSEALQPAARRAAHHISHLLREEAANAAAFLRNNDAAVDQSRTLRPPHNVHFLLDNVRSAYNVGSIFRTADTARCASVITCGFTPHPPNPKLAKTAFGAMESVATRHEESTLHAIRALQAQGVRVYAMETTDRSRSYCDVSFDQEGGVALVLGNEEIGVDTAVMAAVDGLIEIPTFGLKNSLNVASAASIVVYEVLRQWGSLSNGEAPAGSGEDA
jgi:23S rRNA (guanosine2251-2'-O)-methyltransferase